jgi:hypothetical protein
MPDVGSAIGAPPGGARSALDVPDGTREGGSILGTGTSVSKPPTAPPVVPETDQSRADVELGAVLEVAVAQSKEEYDRAERLENKMRQLVTAAGAFFAVVQAVSATLLADVRAQSSGLAVATAIFAVLSVLAFASMIREGMPIWQLRNRRTISGTGVKKLIDFAARGNRAVSKKLIDEYAEIIDQRQAQNEVRAEAYEAALPMAGGTVVLLAVELALVFVGASLT